MKALTRHLILQRPFEEAVAESFAGDLVFSPAVIMMKDDASDTGVSCRQLVLMEPHRPWGFIIRCPTQRCHETDPNMMKIRAHKEKGPKVGDSYTVDCDGCGMRAAKFKRPSNARVYRFDVVAMAFPPPAPEPQPNWRKKEPNHFQGPCPDQHSPPRPGKKRRPESASGST